MFPIRIRTKDGWIDPLDMARGEMDRVLQPLYAAGRAATSEAGVAQYPVDVFEHENHISVEAEMPGFTRDQIDVTIDDGTLEITAERPDKEKSGEAHVNERRFNKVTRRFTLPMEIDSEKVEAKLDNGVLHLKLPKVKGKKSKKIKID